MKAWIGAGLLIVSLPLWGQNATLLRADTLRAEPFSDARPVAQAVAGETVRLLERKGTWASVEAKSERGWVRLLNLKTDTAPQKTESALALNTGREAHGGTAIPLVA